MQFCICFAIFLGVPEGIDHKNRPGGADLCWLLSILCRPARVEQTVLYLFCYIIWTFETALLKTISIAEQICIGCYRSLVAQPEQNKQFCICFCILLWIPGSIVKKNWHCPAASPHFQKTHVLSHFLSILSLIFITVYGLGGASADRVY